MNATAGDMPQECSYAQENMEGFVLAALDSSDQSRISNHVHWCEACQPVHAKMKRVAGMLAFSTKANAFPADRVRSRLLQRVQEPAALVGAGSFAAPSASAAKSAVPDALDIQSPANGETRRATVQPKSGWSKWMPAACVAPLLIALIVVSAWGIGQRNQVSEMQQQLAAQTRSNSTKSGTGTRLFTTRPACPSCTGSGQLGANPADSKAFLLAWDLDPGEQHEVWCVHPDGESNLVAVLNVNEKGQVMQNLQFSQPISGYREIRIVRHNDASPELIIAVTGPPEGLLANPFPELRDS